MTKRFYSISARPGTFGTQIYTKLFEAQKIDATYEAKKAENDIEFVNLFYSLRHSAAGISVSMPFKRTALDVLQYSNSLPNINTLIPRLSSLPNTKTPIEWFGYNCDIMAISDLLHKSSIKSATIVGTGAIADSVFHVLKREHSVANVAFQSARHEYTSTEERTLLVNATPIGMEGIEDNWFNEEIVDRHDLVLDAVISKEPTKLQRLCQKRRKLYIPGHVLAAAQIGRQFTFYTGTCDTGYVIENTIKEMGYGLQ